MAYAVEFAPDGKHFQTIKRGDVGSVWNYFTSNWDIRGHLVVNPYAKFRMKNEKTGKIIGELPQKNGKLSQVI